jgi:hypothetical protein
MQESSDHFPWYDAADHAALMADVARVLSLVQPPYPPGGTPAQPAPVVPPPSVAKVPAHIVTRYGVTFCTRCNFEVRYCGCKPSPSPSPAQGDGTESSLGRRIRDMQGAP